MCAAEQALGGWRGVVFVFGFWVALARFGKIFCGKKIFLGQLGCDGFGNLVIIFFWQWDGVCAQRSKRWVVGGEWFSFLVFGLRWRVLARFFVEKRFFWGNWAVTGLEIWL